MNRFWRAFLPTFRYWMETEVHVYGFSIAANVLLSFFPFLIVMVSLCRYLLKWPGAEQAIFLGLNDIFPGEVGGFVQRNLRATVDLRGPVQIGSIVLLFFTANGVFEPLEVALNRVFGITTNRSFLKNQLVSMGLIFATGGLALMSSLFTAANREMALHLLGPQSTIGAVASLLFFKTAAVPLTILMIFLVYWLLPNKRLPWKVLVPPAIFVGLALEALKYINLVTGPFLRAKLVKEYGPFVNSVTIVLWSFCASMILLAGAEWAARVLAKPAGLDVGQARMPGEALHSLDDRRAGVPVTPPAAARATETIQ